MHRFFYDVHVKEVNLCFGGWSWKSFQPLERAMKEWCILPIDDVSFKTGFQNLLQSGVPSVCLMLYLQEA